jgi:Raf kinase inhibitor-like YbhB/YbcL family protein
MRKFECVLAAGAMLLASLTAAQADFAITSSAFKDGTPLAKKNAGDNKANPNCVGENVSPPLAWSGAPEGTKSYILLMFDPEGRNGLGVSHWVAYGIPASVTGFAEGEVSKPSDKYVGGKGTAGAANYMGPCTPAGTGYHHYTFTLIATDLEPTALKPGMTREEVLAAATGHAKSATGLIGLFIKP